MIDWRLLSAARGRLSDLSALLLVGFTVLLSSSLGLAVAIPSDGHPNYSLRAGDGFDLAAFLSLNLAWLALLGAALVLAVAELVRRRMAWRAAAAATLGQSALALPAFMGNNEALAAWRPWIIVGFVAISFALFAALFGLARRTAEALLAAPRPWARIVPAGALAVVGAGAITVFLALHRYDHICSFPFVAVGALFWVQASCFAFGKSALPLLGDRGPKRPARIALTSLGVLILLVAIGGGIGISDGVAMARVRGILKVRKPQIFMLCDLEKAGAKQWARIRHKLAPRRAAAGFVSVKALPGDMAPTVYRHVILVVADAMRRDYLGGRDGKGSATPHIDELAAVAVVYENAFSPAAGTGDSMPSVLTGLMPNTIAHAEKIPVFLPQLLKRHGYASSTNIRAKDAQFFVYSLLEGIPMRKLGMSEASSAAKSWRKADEENVDALMERMRITDGPRFEYLHLMATHGPFNGPSGEAKRKAAIASVDRQIDRLVSFMRREGLWEGTVLVFVADHGEGLGEHGMWAHAQALYSEQIAVPLIVRVPGAQHQVISNPVTVSIVPSLVMRALGARVIFGEHGGAGSPKGLNVDFAVQELQIDGDVTWRSIQHPPYAYHDKVADGTFELFDLEKDPGELEDLSAQLPGELEKLKALEKRIVEWELELSKGLR